MVDYALWPNPPRYFQRDARGEFIIPKYGIQLHIPTWERNGIRPLRRDCPHPRYIPPGTRYCEQLHAFIPADLPFHRSVVKIRAPPVPVEKVEKSVFKKIFGKEEKEIEVPTEWIARGVTHSRIHVMPLEEAQAREYIKYRGTEVELSEDGKAVELLDAAYSARSMREMFVPTEEKVNVRYGVAF